MQSLNNTEQSLHIWPNVHSNQYLQLELLSARKNYWKIYLDCICSFKLQPTFGLSKLAQIIFIFHWLQFSFHWGFIFPISSVTFRVKKLTFLCYCFLVVWTSSNYIFHFLWPKRKRTMQPIAFVCLCRIYSVRQKMN